MGSLNAEYNELIAAGEDLRKVNTPYGWSGPAAAAASTKGNQLIDGLEEWAAEIAAARRAAGDVADAITGLLNGVHEAEELARVHHFVIGDDGAIIDQGPPPDVPPEQQEAVANERRAISAELAERVGQVLRTAEDIDNDFCVVLDRILSGHTIDAGANDNQSTSLAAAGNAGAAMGSLSIPAPPPPDATAAQNAAWWATLSGAQRTTLANDRPELVGPRDGVSSVHRDIANRHLLDKEQSTWATKRANILQGIEAAEKGIIDPTDASRLREELALVDSKIAALDSLENRLNQAPDTPEDQKYYLLDISASDDGRVIVAHGNPDTADNVATFVPGTGSNLNNFESNLDRADDMHRAAVRADDGVSHSVIAWMDYDAPNTIPEAGLASYAEDAREPIDRFQDGLRESHEGEPSHNTIIGHSYGSTAVGFAARDEHLAVDDFIAVGSPGVGVDEVSQLHMSPDRVWAISAENDPVSGVVADTGRYGTSPSDPAFGANKIHSSPGSSWPLGAAHSQYWDRQNPALWDMGKVIAGQRPG
ncbi:alpha/beta hydrolase [Prauserella oleivorans]|uniref:Alpha/beta hydrolase n=1 Tax=Prauserella oleivorans TaxID=1478153 RepID=A0ABW5W5F5_9PSEU